MRAAVAIGILLGVLSRIEETTGFSAGISSDGAWCAAAFLVAAPLRGMVALTAANAGYYAWIALTQPDLPLADAAGPVHAWLLLGLLTVAVFGAAGRMWRAGYRFLGALPLALVLVIKGGDALRGGALTDGVGLLAGVALAAASAPSARSATVAAAAMMAVAATGAGAAFLP